MSNMKNVVGKVFGCLTVASEVADQPPAWHNRYLHCRCECGREANVRLDHLTRGKTISCGCLSRELGDAARVGASAERYAALLAQSKALAAQARETGAVEKLERAQARRDRAVQRAERIAAERDAKRRARGEKKAQVAAQQEAARIARLAVGKATGQERQHRLPPGTYERLLNEHGGECAICKRKPTRKLNIDHDHKTGRVRGLLCGHCNFGIGAFRDDIMLLALAMKYLTAEGYTDLFSKVRR